MAEKVTLRVVGGRKMNCAGCENTVAFVLERLPGVHKVQADHKTQLVELSVDEGQTDWQQLEQELDDVGYQVERVPA